MGPDQMVRWPQTLEVRHNLVAGPGSEARCVDALVHLLNHALLLLAIVGKKEVWSVVSAKVKMGLGGPHFHQSLMTCKPGAKVSPCEINRGGFRKDGLVSHCKSVIVRFQYSIFPRKSF